jgi:hypothetical protein
MVELRDGGKCARCDAGHTLGVVCSVCVAYDRDMSTRDSRYSAVGAYAREQRVSRTMAHTAEQATHIIGTRYARTTGIVPEREHVGGGMHVNVVHTPDGRVVVFHGEGVAQYASPAAWQSGDEPNRTDAGGPWAIVATAREWTAEPCEVCGKPSTHSVHDVNASGPWIAVCSDACGDAVVTHADDCDCQACEDEPTTPVRYIVTDRERGPAYPARERVVVADSIRHAASVVIGDREDVHVSEHTSPGVVGYVLDGATSPIVYVTVETPGERSRRGMPVDGPADVVLPTGGAL